MLTLEECEFSLWVTKFCFSVVLKKMSNLKIFCLSKTGHISILTNTNQTFNQKVFTNFSDFVHSTRNSTTNRAISSDHHHLVLKILSAFLRMSNFRKGLLSASLTQTHSRMCYSMKIGYCCNANQL